MASGAYDLGAFARDVVVEARDVLARYEDLDLGLAAASIVVIARRHGVRDLLTLDERHVRVVFGPGDRPFPLLQADA